MSGLFVGFVLGLQGYYTLQRYGSTEALGLLVALTLVRELGPVVAALLFAGRAGTSLTAEIGLMKAGEQLGAHGDDGGRPGAAHPGAALLGGVITMPLLAVVFSAVGMLGGYVVGGAADRRRCRRLLGQMQGGVDVWRDVGNGVVKSIVFGLTAPSSPCCRATRPADARRACRARPPARVVVASLACWAWISC